MKVFFSIVSHKHAELIVQLGSVLNLSKFFVVVIKSNFPGDDFNTFTECKNIYCIDSLYGNGFGKNNNIVFKYCLNELGMSDNDVFIVLNPDVIIGSEAIFKLLSYLKKGSVKLATINLYKDHNKTIYDNSIRSFPKLHDFIFSFIGLGNKTLLDKESILSPIEVDWAAGSFLAFKAKHYSDLHGFDERYFMYCEDIDICYRSFKLNQKITYYPDIDAVHLSKHANRNIFSKHFLWHLASVMRFSLTKVGLTSLRSIV